MDCSVYFSELKVYKAELAAAGQMFVIYIGKVEYYPFKRPKSCHRGKTFPMIGCRRQIFGVLYWKTLILPLEKTKRPPQVKKNFPWYSKIGCSCAKFDWIKFSIWAKAQIFGGGVLQFFRGGSFFSPGGSLILKNRGGVPTPPLAHLCNQVEWHILVDILHEEVPQDEVPALGLIFMCH